MNDQRLSRASVLGKVARVRELMGDEEAAHAAEDDLWQTVLTAIADGRCDDDPAELAAIALRTADFPFARWYA